MFDLQVAAIQMDAQLGAVEANLSHATQLVEQAAGEGAQLIVLPEMFSVGYAYTDRNYDLPEELDGPTGTWVVETARRLGVHLVGSFLARMPSGVYIVAMLAAPDGRQWVYRKIHVSLWENCYFDRGAEPLIAETDLGRIGLIICWDHVFTDLARAYQGRVDLLCIPSSPPSLSGTIEDGSGKVLTRFDELRFMGNTFDGVDWFTRAPVAHARCAGVPVVYAARCGTFYSPIPYGLLFLSMLGPKTALRVLRAVGTRYVLHGPMQGRSCILNADGEDVSRTGQDGEAVLVATVQPGAPDPAALPPVPGGESLLPDIPKSMFRLDRLWISLGRRYRWRHAPQKAT